jgi:hypothetical protein
VTPWGHAAVGLCIADVAALCGWRINRSGILLGSVIPDLDFLFLVPFLGRLHGHRTMTHAPLFQLGLAWLLRRYGFWSVLVGQLAHSIADSATSRQRPGIAWLWPLKWQRLHLETGNEA